MLRVNDTRPMLGGPGTVTAKVASLGAREVLVGLVGEHEAGAIDETKGSSDGA